MELPINLVVQNQKPAEKKSRFRINWDDEDTVRSSTDSTVGKNQVKKK